MIIIDLSCERGVIASFEEANKYTPGILVTRFAPLLHNRHSQQLGQLSTPPRTHSSRPIFFRLLTVTPSFRNSFSFSLFLFFSLSWFSLDLSMIPRHVSFHCLSSAFAHSLAMPFLFLSLSFCHFQFQSPSFLSPRSNPVDLSVSISIHSSLTLSIHHLFFLFTLFSYIYFPPSLIHRCANFYPSLFILFCLLTLTLLLLCSFVLDLTKWEATCF